MATNREVFDELWTEVARCHLLYVTIKELFTNVDGLNRHAPSLFAEIQRCMSAMLFMQITHLCDNDSRSLTFQALLDRLQLPDGELRDRAEKAIVTFKAACKPLIAHRNKLFAHNDLKVALGEKELEPMLRGHLLDAIHEALPVVKALAVAQGFDVDYGLPPAYETSRQAREIAEAMAAMKELPGKPE